MNKTTSIIITLALIVGIGIIFLGGSKSSTRTKTTTSTAVAQNSEIKDGVQYITIDAKGGYSPRASTAKAGIPTKLIVKTNGTYDCSASLVIRSIGFQKILQNTGEEVIDIGTPKAGEPLQGVCGMGMYNFLVNFN
jgi:plastocyanin domain-containing protein